MKKKKKEIEIIDFGDAYNKSMKMLKKCSSPYGFKAAGKSKDKYARVWGRDSMICSLVALMSGDKSLISQVKKSLLTLMRFQHRRGQIPSNVHVPEKKVSYGGSTGRIDAMLWFLICFSQYVKRTKDFKFLRKHYEKFKKTFDLVRVYEFNDRGLIYIPKGGDWADEYIQEGYVLYDELLYYRAMLEHIYLRKKLRKRTKMIADKANELKKKLIVNFWPLKSDLKSKHVYNSILFKRYVSRKKYTAHYLLPYFNPSTYGFRFDSFANSLALNFNILSKKRENEIFKYVLKNFFKQTNFLLPSFSPVVNKSDIDWKELKQNYSVKFRNRPYEYQNGGLWPMITGFFACALIKKSKEKTKKYLQGINYANYLTKNKKPWEFREYLNGKSFIPNGTKYQAWSAAAGIMAHHALKGEKLFI